MRSLPVVPVAELAVQQVGCVPKENAEIGRMAQVDPRRPVHDACPEELSIGELAPGGLHIRYQLVSDELHGAALVWIEHTRLSGRTVFGVSALVDDRVGYRPPEVHEGGIPQGFHLQDIGARRCGEALDNVPEDRMIGETQLHSDLDPE